MDLRSNLIESSNEYRKGGWKASLTSLILHGALVATIIMVGATSTHRVNAEDKPIRAFISQTAAPPPPPPPPPPPASASSSAPKATPHIQPVQPQPVHNAFIPPREIPKNVPKVAETQPSTDDKPSDDLPSSAPTTAVANGVAGGVPGGVAGGVQGGVVGGQVGGVIGGQVGGVVGGVIGGTGKDVNAEPKPEPAPKAEVPDGPVRVGGDVKAPVAIERSDPRYTDTARNAHVSGVVILEAVIDKTGRVDEVKVLKGLPMGLSEEAERAVRQWRFKPGTMNGEPVDVIFDLTVNFKLQ